MGKHWVHGWSWPRPANARRTWLKAALLLLWGLTTIHGADLPIPASASSKPATAPLNYQETPYCIINWGATVTPRAAPFSKEPPAGSGRILRGVLALGSNPSNVIAFVWQRDEGKLFLNLNRNQDLTDDRAGVFSAGARLNSAYATFTNIHLPFHSALGECEALVDLSFWDYGSRPGCSVAIRSFWQGQVTLQGRPWQVGFVENFFSEMNGMENGLLLLRSWGGRKEAFNGNDGSLEAFQFARRLFLDGHAYLLDLLAPPTDGRAGPALKFSETTAPLGELNLTGKFIQRLVLPGETYLVVLDRPAGVVKVPLGTYGQPRLVLEQGGAKAVANATTPEPGNRIAVQAKKQTVLNVGGPLTNFVSATRHGRDLDLSYSLIGGGNQVYQLTPEDRSQPPAFAVYRGDKQIASGQFEFG